jgi:hypothetical protein
MDTLRLVEVAGDGGLVLMTGDGRRFALAVDEQLRSAVRRSRNGTQTAPDGDRPGPREVQARIRAGADAEQVAAQTGLDVDYVRRFEGPVLAERAHVADLARATAVDRGGDPTLTLERVVLDVLTGEGYDVDDIEWDSRRNDGTRWQVVVLSRAGTARTEATWSFDTATRSLEPVDAEAERLTGVERRRRLSAVRETVFDVERPAPATTRGGTVELLDALARQRGRRPAAAARSQELDPDAAAHPGDAAGDGPLDPARQAPPGEDAADLADAGDPADPGGPADDLATPESPGAAVPAASGLRVVGHGDDSRTGELSIEPDLLSELDLDAPLPSRTAARRGTVGGAADGSASPTVRVPPAATTGSSGARSGAQSGRAASPPTGQPTRPTPQSAVAGERRARRRRAAVPSWDEIVFGAKREE